MKNTRHTQQHASDWERRHLVGTLCRQLPQSYNLQIHAPSKVSALLRLLPRTPNNALLAPPKVAPLVRQLPRTHNNTILFPPFPPKVGPVARQLHSNKSRTAFALGHHIGSRAHSPALIAEYQTKLPDKQYLQSKLHEFYQLSTSDVQKS